MSMNASSARNALQLVSICLVLALTAANPEPVGFLVARTKAKELNPQELLNTVLGALEGNSTRADDGSLGDLAKIQETLRPIIAASEKNKQGRLGDDAARYALHRLFMERHGWDIKGFGDAHRDASSHASSSSQPSVFQHWVPPEVQTVLEKSVRDRGFGILELSVFAATLEHLIREEMPRKLEDAYRAIGLPSDGVIDKLQAEALIDLYMGAYIRAEDVTMLSGPELFKFQTSMSFMYNNWDETRNFFRQIQESVVHDLKKFSFADVAAVLDKIEANFVYWNDHQCQSLKGNLIGLEKESPGRVRLLDFYDAALYKGMYQFVEKVSYLRQLGAIDEADPMEPNLILSNYIDGPSNCVARTSYYSVCCMDECADLYSDLEKQLGKPEATAWEIIPIIEGLSSATTCTMLAENLQEKLHDIADANGGKVLLHGKAFAEWMHFVYPRECTWPQKFGAAHYQTMEEWELSTRIYPSAETPELMRYSEQLGKLSQVKQARATNDTTQQQPENEHRMAPKEETPMFGASKKNNRKKRLQPSAADADAGTSSAALTYWWVGPAIGALYGAALGVVKLLGFRCESLQCLDLKPGAGSADSDVFRHV